MPVSEQYQAAKPRVKDSLAIDSGEYMAYADALRAGDEAECKRLRAANTDDPELTVKFRTIERQWLAQMALYVHEVQIVRRSRDGWRQIALAMTEDNTPSNRKRLVTRGTAVVAQAELALADHEELDVPMGFKGIR